MLTVNFQLYETKLCKQAVGILSLVVTCWATILSIESTSKKESIFTEPCQVYGAFFDVEGD